MARHKPISKSRWFVSQKRLCEAWQEDGVLAREQGRLERCYLPLLLKHHPDITEDTRILELCSGPVCTARLLDGGEKTYLDPMLDEYRRMYPGKLPKGKFLALAAEKIPENDHSFDLILCINGLDHVLNPELVLNEIERLIKPSGTLLIGMPVFPAPLTRLRYYCERFFSLLRDEAHPYSYSLLALRRTLSRHFDVLEETELDEASHADSRSMISEYAFICRPKVKTRKKRATKTKAGNT
jgi:ubiquinone/menaquinone biosynthesis C-methylase UbiE